MPRTPKALIDGQELYFYGQNNANYARVFADPSGQLNLVGGTPGNVYIGNTGAPSNLVFEESAFIQAVGSGIITLGYNGNTINLAQSGVTYRIGNVVGNLTVTGGGISGSGSAITALTAGNLTGTIPSAVLGNSSHYIGTTSIALNRASASQTLSGVSIDGYAKYHTVTDSRAATTTPQTIDMGVAFDFKQNSAESLSDGGTYFGEMTFRKYGTGTDWSGGPSHQLGFTENGNIWQRAGSSTAWGSWKKILDSYNYNSYAPTLIGTAASGTWAIAITGNAATATAWQTGRTLTIGSTGKSVDGTGNVSWSLAEIGVYPSTNPSGYNTGTVTYLNVTVPTGLYASGVPVTTSGTINIGFTNGYSIPTTASQTNWDTAYTDRMKWDGGSSGLTASTGRTSLGATTVGSNLFTLTNPSAITFLRVNADNTVTALSDSAFRTAIGLGNVENTALSTWAGSSNITTVGTLNGPVTINRSSGYPNLIISNSTTGAGAYNLIKFNPTDSTGYGYIGVGGSGVANTTIREAFYMFAESTAKLVLGTSDTARLTIDTAGNVGISTGNPLVRLDLGTHLTTGSQFKVGTFEIQGYAVNNGSFMDNLYYNGGWKYRDNGFGEAISFEGSNIIFRTAPSGSAGAAATVTDRVTIKSNGNTIVAGTVYATAVSGLNVTSGVDPGHTHSIYASGTHTHAGTYEPVISAGTTGQYWRGDKSWQTLDKSAVGLGSVENTALSTWAGTTNITTLGTITTGTWNAGNVIIPSGTISAPSLSIINDSNTGLYSPAANKLALVTNGVERLFVDSNTYVGIGTNAPLAHLHAQAADSVVGVIIVGGGKNTVTSVGEINAQLDFRSNDSSVASTNQIGGRIASVTEIANGAYTGLAFSTYNQSIDGLAERLRITYNGNTGVGTTTPLTRLHVAESTTAGVRGLTVSQHNDGMQTPQILMYKSRGSVVTPSSVVEGDYLGRFAFAGYTSSSYVDSAWINVVTAGTITATSVPSYMSFHVTKAAGTTPTEAMRIYSSCDIGIGTVAAGASIGAMLHVIKTAEQLRLGYDSSNYTSFTVDSGGDLLVGPTGKDLILAGSGSWYNGQQDNGASVVRLIRSKGMGYNPISYPGVQLGTENNHIAMFIDPGTVAGGAFNGNINEIMLPNLVHIQQANTGSTDWLRYIQIFNNGKVGFGVNPLAQVHIQGTTEQFRVGYDASNYLVTTVSNVGAVTISAVGSSAGITTNAPLTAQSGITSYKDRGAANSTVFGVSNTANYYSAVNGGLVTEYGFVEGAGIDSPVILMWDKSSSGPSRGGFGPVIAAQTNCFTVGKVAYSANPATATTPLFQVNSNAVATFFGQAVYQPGFVSAPTISASGDSDTGIYFPAANTFNIATGGTQRLSINSLGNTIVAGTLYATAVSGLNVTSGVDPGHTHSIYASGTHNHAGVYEPVISAGTTAQYWRGDKSWQTLDKTAVGLGNVENTALSTWAGSANITTLGTVTTGTWNAGSIIIPSGTIAIPSLSFTNDSNTGLFSPSGDCVAITTNGTQRIIVDPSGFIGIGTSTPQEKLEINGDIRFSHITGGTRTISITQPTSSYTDGTNLVIKAGSGASGSGATWGGTLELRAGNPNSGGADRGGDVCIYAGDNQYGQTTLNGDIILYTGHTSLERMRILGDDNTGNIGIGTVGSTVSARLHTISTTEQLRVGYNASNYYSTTVSSAGAVAFDAVGTGAIFTFSDRISCPGSGTGSERFGANSFTRDIWGTAVGTNAIGGSFGVALGAGASSFTYATAIGYNSSAVQNAIAIGMNSSSNGGVTIGKSAIGASNAGTLIGADSYCFGDIGIGGFAVASGNYTIAIGYGSQSRYANSFAFGGYAKTTITNQFMLGSITSPITNHTIYSNTGALALATNTGTYLTVAASNASLSTTLPFGVGAASPSAALHVKQTTEQLRLGYDDTHYTTMTVSNLGGITFDQVGYAAGLGFSFNKNISCRNGTSTGEQFGAGASTVSESVAVGYQALTSGPASVAIGVRPSGSDSAIAIGYQAKTSIYSIALGKNTIARVRAVALGSAVIAEDSTFTVGQQSSQGTQIQTVIFEGAGNSCTINGGAVRNLYLNSLLGTTAIQASGVNKLVVNNAGASVSGILSAQSFDHIILAAPVWEDLRILPSSFDFGGNSDPALTTWQPGGGATFRVWEFDANNEAFFSCQLPHGYATGRDIGVHVHWTPTDRGVAESGKTVAWKLDASWANINDVFPSSTRYDLTDTCTGVNDKHEMTSEVWLSGVNKGISSMLMCRIFRDAGDTWATNSAGNRPVLLEVDFHVPLDTIGSRAYNSK